MEVRPSMHNDIGRIDPNKASHQELVKRGIPQQAATNLVKYIQKGGKIKSDSDLLKIYGMDTSTFTRARNNFHITAPVVNENYTDSGNQAAFQNINAMVIHLNQATAEELTQLNGIGQVLSSRMIKYRDLLGGYHSISQIMDIYGMPMETYEAIKNSIVITGKVRKMYPPSLSFKQVLQHPYTDYETTKLLKNISIHTYEQDVKNLIDSALINNELVQYLHLSDPEN